MIRAGLLHVPFGTGRHAPIAAEDQARVIVGILEDPSSHRGKIYPLYGPVEFTHEEIAQVLSRVLGKDVPYKQVSLETMLQILTSGGQKPPAEHTARGLYGEFEQKPEGRTGESFLIQHLREVAIDHPERCLCRRERRGREDRRTPADDARGVHHQAPPGLRLTTREKNMGKLEGKIALITGGTSGIGLATAKRFVSEGAYVFITGRREPELAAAGKEVGRNITAVRGDVSNLGDLDRLFARIKREKGRLDVVFANGRRREACAPGHDHRGSSTTRSSTST